MKDDRMGRTCGMHGGEEKCIQDLVLKPEDLCIDGRAETGLIRPSIGISSGLL
jgi:hypothetical protein